MAIKLTQKNNVVDLSAPTSGTSDYTYKSAGQKCTVLDEELPCTEESPTTGEANDPTRIYKNLFEIYRRDLMIEFNSSILELDVKGNKTLFVYGNTYEYYEI